MIKSVAFYSLLFLLFLLISCKKPANDYLELNIPQNTKLIGHKGSGTLNETGNIGLQENTWEAISNAMNYIDGSEIDLQLSADSTLWVFHNDSIINCSNSILNFSLFTDQELHEISECNYNSSLLKLSDLLHKIKQEPWKEKLLCLDLKVFYNIEAVNLFEDHSNFSTYIRDKLKRIIDESKVEIEIKFEVFTHLEFKIFDSVFKGQTYLVDPFPSEESILANNKAKINLSLPIHNLPKNLNNSTIKLQDLWTINSANEFFEAMVYTPEIMQSDNIPMMHFFKAIQKGSKALRISKKEQTLNTKDEEFHSLLVIELPMNKERLIQFNTLKGEFQKEVILVFKAVDENGNTVHWQGVDLSEKANSYFFINPEFLMHKNAKTIHIDIWNKSISTLDHKFSLSQIELE